MKTTTKKPRIANYDGRPHVPTASIKRWLKEIKDGRSKSEIERDELGDVTSNGNYVTHLIYDRLGINLKARHPMMIENDRLRAENDGFRAENGRLTTRLARR